jgi:hypothetical protein
MQVQGINEKVTVVNSASTGTINFNASDQSILYYTQNATANWTINVRGSASITLNSIMSAGQSLTLVYMATQGGTAFIPNAFSIDGVSVTPKFSGGAIWTGGNASSIDVYTYTIIKISDATFTVLAGQSTYK